MDPDEGLERVSPRRGRPSFWIIAWAAVLGAVVLLAIITSGRPPAPAPDLPQLAIATHAAPSAGVASSPRPTSTPRPVASRPPLGEDGLVGGLVFGTNWPP